MRLRRIGELMGDRITMRNKRPKDAMRLVGFDRRDKVVYEQLMSRYDYYEGLHPVIDSDDFRRERGIVRLVGTKFDDRGEAEGEWENHYTEVGAIARGIVRDKQGTVTRDTEF
jgi:hypothetical protein